MFYAFIEGEWKTVVVAADSLSEMTPFLKQIRKNPEFTTEIHEPDCIEMLQDPALSAFAQPPIIVTHATEADRDAFVSKHGITVVGPNKAADLAQKMMRAEQVHSSNFRDKDKRTIGEILGIDEDDPWDHRSNEDKDAESVANEDAKKAFEEAQKSGNLSNASFTPPKPGKKAGKDVRVTNIRSTFNPDGSISIDNVNAFKDNRTNKDGEGDKTDQGEQTEAAPPPPPRVSVRPVAKGAMGQESFNGPPPGMGFMGMLGSPENKDENGDNLVISDDGLVGTYFKVTVKGAKLATLAPIFQKANFPISKHACAQRDNKDGCWFASVRKVSAETIQGNLRMVSMLFGFTMELTAVDPLGNPILEDTNGAEVLDTDAEKEEPIRPWNDRRPEWDALTDEEKEENRKSWKGKEFFCRIERFKETGFIVHVVPASYFMKHEEMCKETYDISHILPKDVTPVEDWAWSTNSSDENTFKYAICNKAGMVEYWEFGIYLNWR